jgi:Spy/CpxP family protein refolding chaperone
MNNNGCGLGYHWRWNRASFIKLAGTSLIMMLAVTSLTPTPSLGEERGRVRPNRQQVLDKISAKLQLSEQQMAAVRPIFDEEAGKRRVLMDKLRVEMERLDRETAVRLAKVLSAEQMAQYDKMVEERRNRSAARQAPPSSQENVSPRPPRDGGQPRPRQ